MLIELARSPALSNAKSCRTEKKSPSRTLFREQRLAIQRIAYMHKLTLDVGLLVAHI